MVSILRRYQQPLMITVTVLIIISFTYWGASSGDVGGGGGGGKVATVYGRPVTYAQTQKIVRKFDLAQQLGMRDLAFSLAGLRQDRENFIWNTLVLRHEAEKLGVEPSDDEV